MRRHTPSASSQGWAWPAQAVWQITAWASGKVIWEVKESYEGEYTFWEEQDLSKGQAWYVIGNP